jgi:hypothetical protein
MNAQTGLIMPDTGHGFRHALDLRVSHEVYSRGDLLVWLTWNRITREPCMVLTPKRDRISNERIIPCIIPLSRAWAWSEEVGDLSDVLTTVGIFLGNLGINPMRQQNVRRLIGVVRGHLGDLLAMPPMPESPDMRPMADMTITNHTTGAVLEREVRDDA